MIEWQRTLSPPLRYSIYVAGVLLMCFIAVGVGAAAAVVVSPQFERAATGTADTAPAGTGTLEGCGPETTGTAITSEGTAIEPSGDSKNSGATVDEVSFVHRATKENSCGDHTYISNPLRAFLTILLCA